MQDLHYPWSLEASGNTTGWEDLLTTEVFLEQRIQIKFSITNVLAGTSNDYATEVIHHELGISIATESCNQLCTVATVQYKWSEKVQKASVNLDPGDSNSHITHSYCTYRETVT